MKFDYVIGNPPYQEEAESESTSNGQKPRKNIFQHFQIQADKIAKDSSVLIYPGGRWMHQSGKGLKQFGKDLINDCRLASIEFYPDAKEVFGSAADLADGVTIVTKRQDKATDGFDYIYSQNGLEKKVHADNPGSDLMPLNPNDIEISSKIRNFVIKNNYKFLHDAILPRSLFAIESDFVEKNPTKVREYIDGEEIDVREEIKLFTNDKAGKAGRAKWFVADRSVIKQNVEYIDEFQVVVSSANAGGQKRDNQIAIIDNYSAYGRSRVALRSFKTFEEAKNFYEYAKSYVVRYAFLMTDEALTSLGLLVPDIEDYSLNNGIIDFNRNIDEQLYSKIQLNDSDIAYIKNVVDNHR